MINIDQLIAKSNELTPLPETIRRLVGLLSEEDVNVSDVEDAFSYDGALSAKLLRQANSVHGSVGTRIGTVSAAVVRLGFDNILAMAVAACTQEQLTRSLPQYGLDADGLRRHAQAARLAVDGIRKFSTVSVPPEAATAALLHDIGKVVMAESLDSEVLDFLHQATGGPMITMDAERELLTVHHGELGGLIAQHWNLPSIIVRGIIYHHDPHNCTEADNWICHLTCVADWFAHAAIHRDQELEYSIPAPLSMAVLGIEPTTIKTVTQYVLEGSQLLSIG